jgi:prepilin-type N-terminal cleavage/methylation domain-containing protein
MSFNNIKTKLRTERGFTIVELLVVIVVIGILAAITIVAYNGITARANTSASALVAANIGKKIEIYNSEKATYPVTLSLLTAGTNSGAASYVIASSVSLATAVITTAPATNNVINFNLCGTSGSTTAPTSYAGITVPTGAIIGYWSFSAASLLTTPAGQTTGTAGATGTYPIACFISIS